MDHTIHPGLRSLALPPLDSPKWQTTFAAFVFGVKSALSSILALVLFGTFIGVGAFAHDTGFTLGWALASTILVWAGPAQIILISTSHTGATLLESALAVTISGIRLLPMVVSVLPMLRTPQTKIRQLALPAHLVAVTAWRAGDGSGCGAVWCRCRGRCGFYRDTQVRLRRRRRR